MEYYIVGTFHDKDIIVFNLKININKPTYKNVLSWKSTYELQNKRKYNFILIISKRIPFYLRFILAVIKYQR